MKHTRWLILAALFALSAAQAAPVSARSTQTTCAGVIANTTILGDLSVPERVYCELDNVTVLGDLRVHAQSSAALYGSQIEGSIIGARFELVTLQNGSAGGDIRLTGGVSAWVEDSTVQGDVRLVDNLDIRVIDSHLLRSLTVLRARSQIQF